MNDADFHETMAAMYRQQRPAEVCPENWKNRTRVSAKLDRNTYAALLSYCKQEGFSINTALRQILSRYFKINNG